MNIIEAVQALAEKRCKQIKRPSWYMPGLVLDSAGLISFANGNAFLPMPVDFAATDFELVDSKPVMETIEVKRWMIAAPNGGVYSDTFLSEEAASCKANKMCQPNAGIVELTGSYQRPAKKKVKHRESIPSTCISLSGSGLMGFTDYEFYAEWETEE